MVQDGGVPSLSGDVPLSGGLGLDDGTGQVRVRV